MVAKSSGNSAFVYSFHVFNSVPSLDMIWYNMIYI